MNERVTGADGKKLFDQLMLASLPEGEHKDVMRIFIKYGVSLPNAIAMMLEITAILGTNSPDAGKGSPEDK